MQAPQVSASLAACLFAAVLTLSHMKLRCQLILRLGLRLPTAFREYKGAHLQATQKNVSAHTHSSTAILQLQRAGLRERITCSIAVISITIICIRIIIISCIRSEQTDCSECWSVGRSVVSVCRCAPQCSSRAAANTSSSARCVDTTHRNLRSIHSPSTAWTLALLLSSLHRRHALPQALASSIAHSASSAYRAQVRLSLFSRYHHCNALAIIQQPHLLSLIHLAGYIKCLQQSALL